MVKQESFYIHTPHGEIKVTPGDALCVHVEITKLTVNRVDVCGNITIQQEGEGYKIGYCYLRRYGAPLDALPSRTHSLVYDMMVQVGKDFMKRHPERMRQAALVDWQNEIGSLESKMSDLRAQLSKIDAERAALVAFRDTMSTRTYDEVREAALARDSQKKR